MSQIVFDPEYTYEFFVLGDEQLGTTAAPATGG